MRLRLGVPVRHVEPGRQHLRSQQGKENVDSIGLTVIVPAYNEEERLEGTVRSHHAYLLAQQAPAGEGVENPQSPWGKAELLVVVNGSTDATGEIAKRLEEELPLLRVWETPEALGKGGAVYQGFRLARGEIVAFCDADNSTTPEELRIVIDAVLGGRDAAIGSRWCAGSRQVIRQPLGRRIASRIFNLIVRLMFGLPFADTQCGAKAFRRKILEPLLELPMTSGWAFDVELLWRLRNAGADILEVPIAWIDGSGSRLRMHTDGPQMLAELLKVRLGGSGRRSG